MSVEKKPSRHSAWEEYEAGTPAGTNEVLGAIRDQLAAVRNTMSIVFQPPQEGAGDKDEPGGDKAAQAQDNAEVPDTGPWIDNRNYKAKIRAIRTDKNGAYQGTTLEAQEDYPKNGKKGDIMILRNKNWESEFKRAQSAGKMICLRMGGDGKVQSIEVLD